MTAQRNIVVVNHDAMMNDSLYRSMHFVGQRRDKREAKAAEILAMVNERVDYEATRERIVDGELCVAQSPDIKHVIALADNESIVRLFLALKSDVRSIIFPQSQDDGKSDCESSNLKAYKKLRELAECIWTGSSSLERVAKVWSVCAYYSASRFGVETLTREFSENFLSGREFRSINQGSVDLWNAIDDLRSKHMTTGAPTQTSQMVRTLVTLRAAKDVRRGNAKDTFIDHESPVMLALMRRFGQVTVKVEYPEAFYDYSEVQPVEIAVVS